MTAPLKIGVNADSYQDLGAEVEQRLLQAGLECTVMNSSWPVAEKQRVLAQHDILVSIFPEDRESYLCLGLAAGTGTKNMILSTRTSAFPAGAQVYSTLQGLMKAVSSDEDEASRDPLVTHRTFESLKGCKEGVGWFKQHYPKGGTLKEWTPEKQLEVIKAGGGQWIKMAFDHGLGRQWPMNGVDLRGADLTRLHLVDAVMTEADLEGAVLTRSLWRDAKLVGTNFAKASMRDSVLHGCDLSDARLEAADLQSAHLREVKLDGADLSDARLVRSQVRKTTFKAAKLGHAVLAGASFEAADFSGARLDNADLTGAHFARCNFAGARLKSAVLRNATFLDCDLAGADLTDADTAGSYIKGGRR